MTDQKRLLAQAEERGRQLEKERIVADLTKLRHDLCGEEWSPKKATLTLAIFIANQGPVKERHAEEPADADRISDVAE
jgi:hypothetical protein